MLEVADFGSQYLCISLDFNHSLPAIDAAAD